MFVERENGKIVSAYASRQEWEMEEIADDAPELLAFLNPPPPRVDSVSSRQFKLQLLASGLLDQVNAWVATQPRALQISYEYSGSFVRSEPMMEAGFAAMGSTPEQIDAFFTAAAQL